MVKTRKKNISIPLAICICMFSCMLFLIGSISAVTGLVLNETVSEKTAEIILMVATCLAAFIGSMIGSIIRNENKAMICFATGGSFYALLLILHYFVFPGAIHGLLPTLFAVLVGTVLAYLVGNNKKSRGYKRIKKYRLG